MMRNSRRFACCTAALLALQSRATFAQPARAKTAGAPVVMPRFRATLARWSRDTAWFFSTAPVEGVIEWPVVAYAPATGRWTATRRSWREIEALFPTATRSGGITIRTDAEQAVGAYRLASAPGDCAGGCVVMVSPSGERRALRFDLSPARRRELYRAGRGSWPANRAAPRFGGIPSLWATEGARVALAFNGALASDERETDEHDPPVMSGILVFDSTARRLTPVVHSSLIGAEWRDMVLAGGRVFVVPTWSSDEQSDDTTSVRLASYNTRTSRWTLYRAAELPMRGAAIDAIATDGCSVFVASADGLAALDAATGVWRARFYVDSTYRLPDGADTLVTALSTRRPPGAKMIDANDYDAMAAADSAFAVEEFVRKLAPRHRSDLRNALRRLVSIDTIKTILDLDAYDDRGHDRTVDDFERGAELASIALGRREFVPFLREAMWHTETQNVAADALRRIDDRELVSAWRATLDSGTATAGFYAADSLMGRGDPTAARWLRARAPRARTPTQIDGPFVGAGMRPTPTMALAILAQHGDTASIGIGFAALPMPDSAIDHTRQDDVLWAMMWLHTPTARRMVARGVEERPWLWDDYLAHFHAPIPYQTDTLLTQDPEVRAIVARIEARRATPTRPPGRTRSSRASSSPLDDRRGA